MDGANELSQLSHLLQVAAEATRQIATLRPRVGEALEKLARRLETTADELARVAQGGPLS